MEDAGGNTKNRRGRPLGYRLSEETKDKIRRGRLDTTHSQETKDKISKSLSLYFQSKVSLSSSIEDEYRFISEDAVDWINTNRNEVDETEDVMTSRHLVHLNQLEICTGSDIENMFGHSATPEFLILIKEEIKKAGLDIGELYSLI